MIDIIQVLDVLGFISNSINSPIMKCVAIVPIKLNNRRLPGKNTRAFTNGNPLCTYILNTLMSNKRISEVYVYCSNEEIKQYLPKGVLFLKRPGFLDDDDHNISDILDEFTRVVDADIYVQTHATAPFISNESLDKGLDAVIIDHHDSAFSVKKIQDFIWVDGKPWNFDKTNIPRTQDLKPIYLETSGFYIFTKDVFLKYHSRVGNEPKYIEVPEFESIDIDELSDFEMADAIYNYSLMKAGR